MRRKRMRRRLRKLLWGGLAIEGAGLLALSVTNRRRERRAVCTGMAGRSTSRSAMRGTVSGVAVHHIELSPDAVARAVRHAS